MPTTNSSLAARIATISQQHDNSYPLWQGPCAEGLLGGVTQSMLVRFLSCRERFRLRYILGLEPPDKWNHRIGYGNMWHVCEEVHASGVGDWRTHLGHYTWSQGQTYPLQREEIYKWSNVCTVQFPEYVSYWESHPDVKNRIPLMQEQVFDIPYSLPSGRVVRLRGKFDSVDLIGDSIYLQENKTKGDIDKVRIERQLKFDLQTMMYLTAMIEADTELMPAYPVKGVRYNVVRRPLSGGVGNIKPHAAKFTKTKAIPAETDEQFYERLRRDYIAEDPGYWFFRIKAEISGWDIQVFRDTCLNPLLETVCDWYEATTTGDIQRIYNNKIWTYQNYRTPFGVWSALEEGGATEYDAYLDSGSEAGLRRVETLFGELQ